MKRNKEPQVRLCVHINPSIELNVPVQGLRVEDRHGFVECVEKDYQPLQVEKGQPMEISEKGIKGVVTDVRPDKKSTGIMFTISAPEQD